MQTYTVTLSPGSVYTYVSAVNAWQKQKEKEKNLIAGNGKESIAMDENKRRDEEEDPTPLTDEELEQFQKREKRKVTIIGDIIDFIVNFFR